MEERKQETSTREWGSSLYLVECHRCQIGAAAGMELCKDLK